MSKYTYGVALLLGSAIGLTIVLALEVLGQPNTAPDWKYGAASGDVQRRIEYDKDGDHINVNLRGLPTPQAVSATDRCKLASDTTQFVASCDGGAYQVLGGGTGGCACASTGVQSSCTGPSCSADGSAATAVGFGSIAQDAADVCVGHDAACAGPSAAAVGQGLTCTGANAVCIGQSVSGTGANVVCIGQDANCPSALGIGIGAAASPGAGICIGAACASTNDHFVVGSVTQPIDTVVFGNGLTNASPEPVIVGNTHASGANVSGANFKIRPSVSTGTGSTGDFQIDACPAGAPGSTSNIDDCFVAWQVDGETGHLNPATLIDIGNITPVRHIAAAELSLTGVAGTGKVVCVKANGDLGVCADAPAVDGTCTCG